MNTDEFEHALYEARRRVLKIQTKLHRWAHDGRVLWRARCIERCTPGSGSGPEKRNSRKAVTALRADFHQTGRPASADNL